MEIKTAAGLTWYAFPHLENLEGIVHGVFTREGGCSPPPFDSLNVGLSTGDHPANVNRNRRAIRSCFGDEELVFCNQIHGPGVIRIKASPQQTPPTGDAMITDRPGRMLVIQTADCQSVVVADPDRRVVANIHAGWRGSLQNIVGRTVDTMISDYGCSPRHMVAGIGPSLGPCCAEFVNYRQEIPKEYWPYKQRARRFDFWKISTDQLLQTGLPKKNIRVSGLCTRCRTDLFFSYRREAVTGRFATVIGLQPLPRG
jgi:YfiH family protein